MDRQGNCVRPEFLYFFNHFSRSVFEQWCLSCSDCRFLSTEPAARQELGRLRAFFMCPLNFCPTYGEFVQSAFFSFNPHTRSLLACSTFRWTERELLRHATEMLLSPASHYFHFCYVLRSRGFNSTRWLCWSVKQEIAGIVACFMVQLSSARVVARVHLICTSIGCR